MKKVKFENLEIGKRYYIECGIWKMDNMMYVGLMPITKKNGVVKYYPMFTTGNLENYKIHINIQAPKSNIKAYVVD